MNDHRKKQNSENDALGFLREGGEMAERIRAFDWSTTPIGPAESWSPALRMAIQLMLSNRLPMLLWWGPEYVSIYNDPYRPVLGNKHPWGLGRPVSECWQEIWHVLRPLIDIPFQGGPATWNEDILLVINRYGFNEETHWLIAYSPVPDESAPNGIGGVLATVYETTAKELSERRMTALRDLANHRGEAKTAEEACAAAAKTLETYSQDIPFALLYLAEPDGKYARLVATAAVGTEQGIALQIVDLEAVGSVWPLAEAKQTMQPQAVTDLHARFEFIPAGPWPDPPQTALVFPISSGKPHEPAGFFITGISSHLSLDDPYRGFLELVTTQIGTAIANARAFEEEKRRAESLAELDRAKTTFFSNVSHEFRTPLTLILGPLDDAIRETDDGRLRDQLLTLQRNALRLQKLVNTLLDFSRIEARRVQVSYQPVDLAALTNDLASNFRSACEKAGLEMIADCNPLSEPVYVDVEMWEKIVLNLISNAFKFTLKGRIEITLRSSGEYAELVVRDTGVGIPADQMPRLFERFHRVEGVTGRSQEGSGIGLALVRELVRLHGGEIRAESEVGAGTSFIVTMPFGTAHLPGKQVAHQLGVQSTGLRAGQYVDEVLRWLPDATTEDQTTTLIGEVELTTKSIDQAVGHRPRIVLADDNVDMRQYLQRILSPHYHVEAVPDGREALQAIRRELPDLVLTDVMMSDIDGFDLLKALRSDPRTNALPIVMLTARAGEESRVEGMEAGADDYLVKPFSARELLARIGAHTQIAHLRRQVNDTIRESEERFRALVHASSDVVYRMSADWSEMRFLQGREFIPDTNEPSQTWLEKYIHPGDQAHVLEVIQTAVRDRCVFELEHRVLRVDNSIGWAFSRAIPMLDDRGEIIEWFGMASDVTPRKEGEVKLREGGERMRLLWEAAAVLLTTDDPDTMLQQLFHKIGPQLKLDTYFNFMVNESGTGLKLASCIGIPKETVRSIQHLAFGQAICGTVAVRREPLTATFIQESDDPKVQLVKSFGIRAYACNPLMTGGELLGTLSFASRTRDEFDPEELDFLQTICRYVTAAYERLRLIGKLQDADRRKDEFLATLAHELRNPLAPIRNGLEILQLDGTTEQMAAEARGMMERQLAQMVRLINDLLDLSRISRGKIELKKERVELAKVIQYAVETSRPVIEQADHKLVIKLPNSAIFVNADSTRLVQIFSNLLNNAAKYTERNGRIELTLQRTNNEAVISVKDNGVGIPANMLPKVFDMFTQVDRDLERSQGGLGIGLSIVKRLVEMHGGRVEAKSEGRGMGSEFAVRLPVETSSALSSDGDGRARKASGRRRIMVVDDNYDAAISLAMMLELMGNVTKTAHDGIEALEVAAVFRPDLIFLDIGMPRLDGHETAKRIRGESWGEDIVLVALTGWGQDKDRRKSQEVGFNLHVVKPIEPAVLQAVLSSLSTA